MNTNWNWEQFLNVDLVSQVVSKKGKEFIHISIILPFNDFTCKIMFELSYIQNVIENKKSRYQWKLEYRKSLE